MAEVQQRGPDAPFTASGAFIIGVGLPFIDVGDDRMSDPATSQAQSGLCAGEQFEVSSEAGSIQGSFALFGFLSQLDTESAGGGPLQQEIAAFIPAVQHYIRTFFKEDLLEQIENVIRNLLEQWNGFLAQEQDGQHTCALVSRDILADIQAFIFSQLNPCSDDETWIVPWLARWNVFLLARQGKSPVSIWGALSSVLGVLLFALDMASDWVTAVNFACTGHWWRCALTLCVVYAAVAISTVHKVLLDYVLWTGPRGALRYLASLLVSWPNLRECWTLLHAEWELVRSSRSSAHLVPVWEHSRVLVAELKLTEGVWEACPQALLQLVLLLPELQGNITGTVSMRMVATMISLCAAGAAPVNRDKIDKFDRHAALSLGELVVLHVWAVPMTVCRLLCLALLLSIHLYWGLAFMALHLALFWVYWVYAEGAACTVNDWFGMCVLSVFFLVSPFDNAVTRRYRAVRHVLHFLGNAGVTVVWTLTTPLQCTQPTLHTALVVTIPALFSIGLVGWRLHWTCYERFTPPSSSSDSSNRSSDTQPISNHTWPKSSHTLLENDHTRPSRSHTWPKSSCPRTYAGPSLEASQRYDDMRSDRRVLCTNWPRNSVPSVTGTAIKRPEQL